LIERQDWTRSLRSNPPSCDYPGRQVVASGPGPGGPSDPSCGRTAGGTLRHWDTRSLGAHQPDRRAKSLGCPGPNHTGIAAGFLPQKSSFPGARSVLSGEHTVGSFPAGGQSAHRRESRRGVGADSLAIERLQTAATSLRVHSRVLASGVWGSAPCETRRSSACTSLGPLLWELRNEIIFRASYNPAPCGCRWGAARGAPGYRLAQ
jgi:hypothetical protein